MKICLSDPFAAMVTMIAALEIKAMALANKPGREAELLELQFKIIQLKKHLLEMRQQLEEAPKEMVGLKAPVKIQIAVSKPVEAQPVKVIIKRQAARSISMGQGLRESLLPPQPAAEPVSLLSPARRRAGVSAVVPLNKTFMPAVQSAAAPVKMPPVIRFAPPIPAFAGGRR